VSVPSLGALTHKATSACKVLGIFQISVIQNAAFIQMAFWNFSQQMKATIERHMGRKLCISKLQKAASPLWMTLSSREKQVMI